MKLFLSLLCALCLLVAEARADRIEFFEGTFAEAKDAAARSGKPLVAVFTAKWSSNCQRMQQLVFTNDELAGQTNSQYIAVLLDIDKFDGYLLKEQYGVIGVPTFVRFDRYGSIVDRESGEMTVEQLRLWLSEPGKKAPVKSREAQPPSQKPAGIAKEEVRQVGEEASKQSEEHSNQPARLEEHLPQIAPHLYKWDVSEVRGVGYSLQLGVFSTLDNAVKAVGQFEQQVGEPLPVLLYLVEEDGGKIYKLLTGLYSTREQADARKDQLEGRGLPAFVRPVSEL